MLLRNHGETATGYDDWEFARTPMVDYLRPGGALPPVQGDRQPYGILPATSLTLLKSTASYARQALCVNQIRSVMSAWRSRVDTFQTLARLSHPQAAPIDTLALPTLGKIATGRHQQFNPVEKALNLQTRAVAHL